MKTLGLLGCLLLPAAAFAQKSVPATSTSADVAVLMQLDEKWNDAAIRNDAETITHLLADDYLSVNSRGGVMTKADVLRVIAEGNVKCDVNRAFDYVVRVYGDVAVMVHNTSFRGSAHGLDTSGEYRSTHVWVRRGGTWRAVENHTTRVVPPVAPVERLAQR